MVGFSDLARSSPAVFTVGFVENQKWGWPRWIHNHLYSSFGGHNLNEPPTSVECRVIQLLLGHPSNTFGSREICWLKHRKHNECLPRGLASRPCSQSNKVQKSNHGSKQLKEEDDEGSEFEQPIAVQNCIRDCPEIFECCGRWVFYKLAPRIGSRKWMLMMTTRRGTSPRFVCLSSSVAAARCSDEKTLSIIYLRTSFI